MVFIVCIKCNAYIDSSSDVNISKQASKFMVATFLVIDISFRCGNAISGRNIAFK